MATFREFVISLVPPYGQDTPDSKWGDALYGISVGLMADFIAEGMAQALHASWLHSSEHPISALPLQGSERAMPKYPSESNSAYRARLLGAWDAWEFAGNEDSIEGQFAAAGFVGAEVYVPKRAHAITGTIHGDWLRPPLNYPSHFWVFFPEGSHSFGPPHTVGQTGLVVGGGWVVGTNASYEDVLTVRGIVNKWRPGQEICREMIFEIDDWTVGTGHSVNDVGLVVGGETVTIAPD